MTNVHASAPEAARTESRRPAGWADAPVPAVPGVQILGLTFAALTRVEAVQYCLELCRAPLPRRARWVVPVNAGILEQMPADPKLAIACKAADLVVADGQAVVWTAKWMGTPLPERVPGIDLFTDLLREGGKQGLRVFYLGARREVVERMVEVTQEQFPGVVVAGWRDGYFGDKDNDVVLEAIRASKAQLLLLAMPSPRKEIWGHANLGRFGVNMVLPVGGSFDVLSGRVPRAPRWMQRIGMEWSWRVIKEPRAYALRYLRSNTAYLRLLWRESKRRRMHGGL